MKRNGKFDFLSILILFVLVLTSCGGSGSESDTITTAVAMTVAAKEAERAEGTLNAEMTKAASTPTPEAEISATPTKQTSATFSPPTAPAASGANVNPCLYATYVSETIPDGTIMQPGEYFWKSWRIKNSGACTWDASYKVVFFSGDLMGGKYEYPFPGVAGPGDEIDIPIYMQAPLTTGSVSSYWKMQSPSGEMFGVGEYSEPLWVTLNVTDNTSPEYGVTSVTYNVVRDPPAGCATNVWYYVYATITTNGPVIVKYQWLRKDGNNTGIKTLKFEQADSKTVNREWSFHLGASPGEKWEQIVIHEPVYQEYPKVTYTYDCK